jgi:hypothetical protein
VPIPEQQDTIKRIKRLHAKGLSPYKITDDLAVRGMPMSHMTVRKILARNGRPAAGSSTPWFAKEPR